MQHGEEDGALDGELEAPAFQQGGQNLVDRAGLPEPLEDQTRPDSGATSGDAIAPHLGATGSGSRVGRWLTTHPSGRDEAGPVASPYRPPTCYPR